MTEPDQKKPRYNDDVDILSMDTTPMCTQTNRDLNRDSNLAELLQAIDAILKEGIPLSKILQPLLLCTEPDDDDFETAQEQLKQFNIRIENTNGKLMIHFPSNIYNIDTMVIINTGTHYIPSYYFALCSNYFQHEFDYQLSKSIMFRILFLVTTECIDNPFIPTIKFEQSNYSVCSGETGEYENVHTIAAVIVNGPEKGFIIPSPFNEQLVSYNEKDMTATFQIVSGEYVSYKLEYIYPQDRCDAIGNINPLDSHSRCTDAWEWKFVNYI